MHDAPVTSYAGQRIPFKQEGWGVALFVVLLAVATAAGATYVHKTTYKHPTDVRFRAAGTGDGTGASASHSAPAAHSAPGTPAPAAPAAH